MVQGCIRENASADDGIKKTPREGVRGEWIVEVSRIRMMEPLYRQLPNHTVTRVTPWEKFVVTIVTVL